MHNSDCAGKHGAECQVCQSLRTHHVLAKDDTPGALHGRVANHWAQNKVKLCEGVCLTKDVLEKVDCCHAYTEAQINGILITLSPTRKESYRYLVIVAGADVIVANINGPEIC